MEKLLKELQGSAAGSGSMAGMEDFLRMLGGGGDNLGADDIEQAKALWKMLDQMAENDPKAGSTWFHAEAVETFVHV